MFAGISVDSLMLLAENRFQNSKPFYDEHAKEIKESVILPLRELVGELSETMLRIDPLLVVNPMTNGTVSRVRRDTRFTKDKLLYRENMWIAFLRDKKAWNYCLPAFFMDFSINRVEWGVGFYSATPAIMRYIRKVASENPQRVEDALKKAKKAGFLLCGEPYAKPHNNDTVPASLRILWELKNLDFMKSASPEMMQNPHLNELLAADFTALAPVYRLMTEAVENTVKRDE